MVPTSASLRVSRNRTEPFSVTAAIDSEDLTMRRISIATVCVIALSSVTAFAQSRNATPPDFSGVYFPYQPPRGAPPAAAAQRGGLPAAAAQRGAPPPPTRSAPTGDLSNGRAATAPLLTPEYMAKWEM